jgi:ATP-dependent protease HslVU (ClpYQ) peptidase subunit
MSIIVAVKGEGCVYLAADSQATQGESKYILDPKHGKLRQLTPQLAVGCTGNMNQIDVLEAPQWLVNVGQRQWPDNRELEEVAYVVWDRVVKGLGDRMEKNRDTGAAELPGRLLIAWKDEFIEVDASGQLIKPDVYYHAIGSGADIARTAIWAEGDVGIRDELLAEHAVNAACRINIYCSLPVITAVTRV